MFRDGRFWIFAAALVFVVAVAGGWVKIDIGPGTPVSAEGYAPPTELSGNSNNVVIVVPEAPPLPVDFNSTESAIVETKLDPAKDVDFGEQAEVVVFPALEVVPMPTPVSVYAPPVSGFGCELFWLADDHSFTLGGLQGLLDLKGYSALQIQQIINWASNRDCRISGYKNQFVPANDGPPYTLWGGGMSTESIKYYLAVTCEMGEDRALKIMELARKIHNGEVSSFLPTNR